MNRRYFTSLLIAALGAIPFISGGLRKRQNVIKYDVATGPNPAVLEVYVEGRLIAPADYVVVDGVIRLQC